MNLGSLRCALVLVMLVGCGGEHAEGGDDATPPDGAPGVDGGTDAPAEVTIDAPSEEVRSDATPSDGAGDSAPDAPGPTKKWHPGHYVLVGGDALDAKALPSPVFRGVQRIYTWKELEPKLGVYDFSAIDADLAFLGARGKYLAAQITYKTFGAGSTGVPDYVVSGSDFGPHRTYVSGTGAIYPSLWVPAVGKRFQALIAALGARYDALETFDLINLPETAQSPKATPDDPHGLDYLATLGYTATGYADAIKSNMLSLATAFPRTVKVQYVNWGPTDALFAYAKTIGVGLGGPDVSPVRDIPAYAGWKAAAGTLPLAAAVQYEDYYNVPKDWASGFIAPEKIYDFARKELTLNYLFWQDSPAPAFANAVKMMGTPTVPGDPAGGLVSTRPTSHK